MEDLSLHILDVAENSIRAQAKKITIKIQENRSKDLLSLDICDNGEGMDQKTLQKAVDPFFSTQKSRRFGLGLSLLSQAAQMANGHFSIQSQPGKGTKLRATFQISHLDTKPLGNIPETLTTLMMGHPEVDFQYEHKINHSKYSLDTQNIKSQLKEIPLNSPKVLNKIKKNIKEELDNLRRQK
ncbi:ATP-binding protein [bacterium]|nr:ATP-binding protein [bacterium]